MSSNKIVRTKTRAEGGITPEEAALMAESVKLWTARGFRTEPIEPDKIIPAIEGLYAAAGAAKPEIFIALSPVGMAFKYGTEAALRSVKEHGWPTDKDGKVLTPPDNAAELLANLPSDPVERYRQECYALAGQLGLECASKWHNCYQGGNMRASYCCYLSAMRDIIGLDLPEYKNYRFWEDAAIHGGFRVIHKDFCVVSDFYQEINLDEENQPHNETGPSILWRDGVGVYHWHGVEVPKHWIEDRDNLDPKEVIKVTNVEQRAVGVQICGPVKMSKVLKIKVIHDSGNATIGKLVEMTLPGLKEKGLFLQAECPRNGTIMEGVPRVSDIDGLPITTALAAQAYRLGDAQADYQSSPRRT